MQWEYFTTALLKVTAFDIIYLGNYAVNWGFSYCNLRSIAELQSEH